MFLFFGFIIISYLGVSQLIGLCILSAYTNGIIRGMFYRHMVRKKKHGVAVAVIGNMNKKGGMRFILKRVNTL